MGSQLLRTKSIDRLIAETQEPGKQLRKVLGPWSLTALGIGAIIGTGIFILTGTAAAGEKLPHQKDLQEFCQAAVAQGSPAAAHCREFLEKDPPLTTYCREATALGTPDAKLCRSFLLKSPLLSVLREGWDVLSVAGRPGAGPAIALSFLLVAFACALAGLCYAELASMIPVAGSAYTYSYATLGEIFAWVIGWDLILEYAVSNMAVAVGFSAHVDALLESFGLHLPAALSTPAYTPAGGWAWHFNLPGFLAVLALTVLLVIGIRESAGANTTMVAIKLLAILVFVFAAVRYVQPTHWQPFMPNGWQGVLTGGAIVFFTYIGFDSVSTAAEECRNPQRDLPLGILASLVVCATFYVTVAVVLTGIRPYQTFLGDAAPVANALHALGLVGIERWVTIGALTGMVSSLLVFQLGQARVWFAMSRDRLLPRAFSRVHPRFRTPHVSTCVAGLLVAIPAAIFDIGTLADLSNIGTLFAFVLVCAGVLVLRRTQPERRRAFRVPWVPVVPLAAIACCLVLMASLPLETWIRFFVWLVIGLVIYFVYSRKRSELHQQP